MPPNWQKIDVGQSLPYYLNIPGDECYYAREYVSKGGFSASEANQLISNFKIDPSNRNSKRWYYKEQAIRQFAAELAQTLNQDVTVAAIPSSTPIGHPDYDCRMDDMFAELCRSRSDITVVSAVTITQQITPSHQGGPRSPQTIYPFYRWNSPLLAQNAIVFIDDVISSGAHYKACERVVNKIARAAKRPVAAIVFVLDTLL